MARALGLDLLVEVPEQRRLAEHLDLGLGPVHGRRSGLARAARSVLAAGAPAVAAAHDGDRPMTSPPRLSPDTLDRVREQLARSGSTLTPEVVALALRDQGRPVGDAMVLAVHDRLRQDVLGAGPLEPLLRLPE